MKKYLVTSMLTVLVIFSVSAEAEDLTNLTTTKLNQRISSIEHKLEDLEARLNQVLGYIPENVGQAPTTLEEQKRSKLFVSEEFEDVAVKPEAVKIENLPIKVETQPIEAIPAKPAPNKKSSDPVSQAGELIASGKYEDAETILLQFIDDPDNDDLAERANIFYGEALIGKKQYELAASQLISTYHKYPKTSRTPVTLINLNKALYKGGKHREACATLNKLYKEFPKLNGILSKAAEEASLASGCSR